jgi:hypothetical protein
MAKQPTYMQDKNGNVHSVMYPEYCKEWEIIKPQAEGKRLYREQVLQEMRETLKPGDTVYTLLRNVSRSGMSRVISLFIVRDNRIRCIDYRVSIILGDKQTKEGIKVNGCGMDMGFHLVYTLGRYLFPDGFVNPDTNEQAKDGGYSLRHEWM